MNRVDLIKHLRRHGCVKEREGKKHTIVLNPANGETSQIPRHREIVDHTVRGICEKLGIPKP